MDVRDALVHTRLIEVGDEHRHLQFAHEQQRELARHEPRADDPDLGDLLRQGLVWGSYRTLRTLLHQVECVHGCRELIACDKVRQGVILTGEPLRLGAALGLVQKIERDVRRLGDGADLRLQHPACHLDRDRPLRESLDLARLVLAVDLDGAAEHAVGPGQRVLEEIRRREDRVHDSEVERLLRLQHAVLLEGIRDDDLEGVLDADEVRQQVCTAPSGNEPEEHLGQRDGGSRGIHGAVCRVQGDLEPTAEGEAVHEGERGDAQIAQRSEYLVSELRDEAGLVGRRHLRDIGQVGPGSEDVLLAGDADRLDLTGSRTRLHAGERLAEFRESGRAQGVRSRVIATVVERDERQHLAGGQTDVAHSGVRDDLITGEGDDGGEVDLFVIGHVRTHFRFLPS